MGSSTGVGGRGESTSPKRSRNPSLPRQDPQPESKVDADSKTEQPSATDAETTKPLAPPPRPAQQQSSGNTPDYFSNQINASLNLEPNPFEQSFGGGAPETPGGTKLPSVAALTSPSSLLPGGGVTPFPWGGGSLRTGPLSPAMLSGPANDYFSSDHIRSFPTPNESSLRTGLTPGGSGSMFPVTSPNPALFALAGSTAPTPGTVDFHRTALSAAAANREQKSQAQTQQSVTSQPQALQQMSNGGAPLKNETKPTSGPFDPHDNDAANGLFMLAQGRNGTQPPQPQQQYPVVAPPQIHTTAAPAPTVQALSTSPQMNGNASIAGSSARGVSEAASAGSDESEIARPNTRAKGKRNSGGGASSRRKAEDNHVKGPASKKAKTNGGAAPSLNGSFDDMDHSDDEMMQDHEGNGKSKMTDEEKRKNFLERNRVAALKCRQRKKQWLANLQNKVEHFSNENDALTSQISQLREEVVNLKTLLLAHKDCPVTQQQGLQGAFLQQVTMEPFNPQMNPYGMGAHMPNQTVPIGARRYS